MTVMTQERKINCFAEKIKIFWMNFWSNQFKKIGVANKLLCHGIHPNIDPTDFFITACSDIPKEMIRYGNDGERLLDIVCMSAAVSALSKYG